MSRRILFLACVLGFALGPSAVAADEPAPSDAELVRLERAKWGDPPGAMKPEDFKALLAEDFLTVEYGAERPPVGVVRRPRQEVFSGPPLPPAKFELSDWKAVHASPDVVILSYKVTGVTFPWKAYATSTWSRRGGKWVTVFYQASTAR